MTDSKVVSPAEAGVSGIHANGDITITRGTTEIGAGSITADGAMQIGGVITANGTVSFDKIYTGYLFRCGLQRGGRGDRKGKSAEQGGLYQF